MKNILISVMMLVLLSGCLSFDSRSARPVAAALKQKYPDIRLEKEFAITAGSWVMDMVDMLALDGTDMDLSEIKRAEVGVYNIRNLQSLKNFEFPANMIKNRECPNLETILKVREDDEYTNVVVCIKGNRINSIFIVAIETNELVVVNAVGNYNAIIETVLKSVNRKNKHQKAPDKTHI